MFDALVLFGLGGVAGFAAGLMFAGNRVGYLEARVEFLQDELAEIYDESKKSVDDLK